MTLIEHKTKLSETRLSLVSLVLFHTGAPRQTKQALFQCTEIEDICEISRLHISKQSQLRAGRNAPLPRLTWSVQLR
jgi:hypothetical protein